MSLTYTNTDALLIDFLDEINFTLSNKFLDKWRFKYPTQLIKQFQLRLLKAMNDKKPVKLDTLYTFLFKRCKNSQDLVVEFLDEIEVDLLNPVILGKLTRHLK